MGKYTPDASVNEGKETRELIETKFNQKTI